LFGTLFCLKEDSCLPNLLNSKRLLAKPLSRKEYAIQLEITGNHFINWFRLIQYLICFLSRLCVFESFRDEFFQAKAVTVYF